MTNLGRVTVVARGASIQWVRIEEAWPKTEWPSETERPVVNRWRLSADMRSYVLFTSKRFGCGPGTGPGVAGSSVTRRWDASASKGRISG